jgi:hypothetical protein
VAARSRGQDPFHRNWDKVVSSIYVFRTLLNRKYLQLCWKMPVSHLEQITNAYSLRFFLLSPIPRHCRERRFRRIVPAVRRSVERHHILRGATISCGLYGHFASFKFDPRIRSRKVRLATVRIAAQIKKVPGTYHTVPSTTFSSTCRCRHNSTGPSYPL